GGRLDDDEVDHRRLEDRQRGLRVPGGMDPVAFVLQQRGEDRQLERIAVERQNSRQRYGSPLSGLVGVLRPRNLSLFLAPLVAQLEQMMIPRARSQKVTKGDFPVKDSRDFVSDFRSTQQPVL